MIRFVKSLLLVVMMTTANYLYSQKVTIVENNWLIRNIKHEQIHTVRINSNTNEYLNNLYRNEQGNFHRYGHKYDVYIDFFEKATSLSDDIYDVYILKISSPGAHSLNFIFSEFYIPEGCELYIYNNKNMIQGPITFKENHKDLSYANDVLDGARI